jgi:hypothetical protein
MSTRAIAALVSIIRNPEVVPSRHIIAAETLLSYEAPPDVIELAKECLTVIFEDVELGVDIRLDALKLMRKFEAPKIGQPTTRNVVRETRDRKEAWREYEIGQRRFQYIKMTHKLPPKGWDDDLRSEDYLPPPQGWPPVDTDTKGLAEKVRAARLAAERRDALHAIEGEKN